MEKGTERMAAAAPASASSQQCRSPRCSAERRGVRRELDSWRHRLMHCVGFESILEGLYGPRLRRDLSLFEDCEPEEVSDWSMDEKCSFCNLHKEAVSDHTAIIGSLQSTPTEELSSQGQSNTDKIECQAENYLNALFRKKDLPQNCDPNIPLVAQELMKKMIRQFAIEYISKSSKMQENRNGSSSEMSLIRKGIHMNQTENSLQEEQDSPLDLTVNRTQENTQQGDGVLDLSTKKTSLEQTAYDGSCSENSVSGSSTAAGAKSEESTKLERGNSALNKVLESLCSYHWHQILAMLKFLIQDPCIPPLCNCQLPQIIYPEIAEDCVHFPVCSCDGYMSVKRCCLQNERANSCLSPLSVYVKDSDSLLCQSVAVGYFNTVVNKGIAVPCNVHRCSPQQFQQSKIHSARAALCTHLFSTGQKINKASRGRSPSPPPLSPVDENEFWEESVEGSLALDNRLEMNANQPPSLLPAERSCSVYEHKDKISFAEASGSLDENFIHAKQENSLINSDKLEKVENAASFQNLMDRINEKLKSIETTDISTLAKLSKSDGKTEADVKLRSFITSLLNNDKANDYNIKELLSQHDKEVENKIIQTRFRKKQETFLAMHNSPNSSLFRRQSLQIKRELASLDETFIRKKSSSEKITKKPTKNGKLSPNKTDNQSTLKDLAFQNHENKGTLFSHIKSKSWSTCQEDSVELPLNDFESNPCFKALSQNSSTTSQTNLARRHGNCGVEFYMDQIPMKGDDERMLDRTKHCIPPVWYSVYVNNFLFQKSSKARNPSDCMERERKRIQAKTCSNEDTNKMVKNTNLHVVVERLEDTINMAQKTNKSLLKGYKISSKLKEIHDANHDSKNGLIGMSESENKGQYVLSQSHGLCGNNSKKGYVSIKENEASDEGCESLLKPSTFDSAALTPNNEDLQTRSDAGDSSQVLNYTSPIKLMFLSEINSSEGIKYTLTSVNDSAKLNIDLYSVQDKTNVLLDKQLEKRDLDKNIAFEECGCGDSENNCKTEVNSVLPAIIANETNINEHKPNEEPVEQNGSGASFKRKPGRPKKIGPQVVKQVKRPIGRPPKPKVDVAENANCPSDSISSGRSASSVADVVEEESINKNITVTVVFGRSRRTKRCVSEGSLNVVGLVPGPPSDCDTVRESQVKQMLETRNSLPKNTDMHNSATKNKPSASGYEYIRLLESSPVLQSHCSNIVRPNQKPLNVIRKPGRPAKVKISGISVTVNQISSQERKVSISSCLPPLEQTTVLEKDASSREDDEQCNKRDDAQCVQSDRSKVCSNQKMATASKKPELPLRQSVRERRPSLPFLHSVASSSPLPCRSAFLHKSYKLHLKNTKDKKRRHHHSASSPSAKENLENANKRAENHFFRAVNESSLDPLISSRPSLRWWDPSISKDSLLKELNNRYEQITTTWLHVNGDEFEKCLYDEDIHVEQDCSIDVSNPLDSCILELENSPIRMLFQKECNINELCAWFMQTTETQSLSLVRKANARNPFEVISTRQFKIGTRQSDCSNSPFRKHFKKFALSTPSKSAGKLQILHKIARSKVLKKKHNFTLAKYKRTKFENLQLDRWRQVKKFRKHGTHDWKSKNLRFFCQSQRFANAGRNMNNKMCMFQGNGLEETQCPTVLVESHKLTSLTGTDIGDAIFQQNTQLSDFSTQSAHCNQKNILKAQSSGEFGEDAWRDTTFKDCRIFLKKINPIEEQHSFSKNTAFCTPESVDLSPSDICFQDKKHPTLRSRSAPQYVSAKCEKHSEGSQRTDTPSLAKGLCIERDTKKSSKRVTFEDGPTEDPKKMNKKRRTQCKPADLNSRKKNKRRLCSTGQVSSCYSKYQLGPLKPVGLPLLGGFPSRAVEYSMIPFQLPLHGSSQVWRPNP